MDGRVQHPWCAIHFPFRCAWLHTTLLCALEGRAFGVHGAREVRDKGIIHPVLGQGWLKDISSPWHDGTVDCDFTSRCNTHFFHCATPNNHMDNWIFRLASSTVTAVTPSGVIYLKEGSEWVFLYNNKGARSCWALSQQWLGIWFPLQIWKLPLPDCLSLGLCSTDTVLALSTS